MRISAFRDGFCAQLNCVAAAASFFFPPLTVMIPRTLSDCDARHGETVQSCIKLNYCC